MNETIAIRLRRVQKYDCRCSQCQNQLEMFIEEAIGELERLEAKCRSLECDIVEMRDRD